jgi:hypothetical protein
MSNGPDPTDATWAPWYQSLGSQSAEDAEGGMRMSAALQPPYDPNEPWTGLAPLKKVSPGAVFDLVQQMRTAGVPVLGSKPRRSGLFSSAVDVTLSVPTRLAAKAQAMVRERFGQ